MLEFYEAYSNYRDLMEMNEELFALLAMSITGSTLVKYGDQELDFSKMQTALDARSDREVLAARSERGSYA